MMKKYLTLALCLALAFLLFAGCQSQISTADTETAGSESGDAIVGQITAINGDQFTLALGTLNMGNRPNGGELNGNGARQNGNGANPNTSAASGKRGPDGRSSGDNPNGDVRPDNLPDGAQPGGFGNGFGSNMFTASGEEMSITVTDDTAITLAAQRGPGNPQNESGSAPNSTGEQSSPQSSGDYGERSMTTTGKLSDLQVGDIITVTLSGNTATAITVGLSRSPGGSGNGFGNADGSEPGNAT